MVVIKKRGTPPKEPWWMYNWDCYHCHSTWDAETPEEITVKRGVISGTNYWMQCPVCSKWIEHPHCRDYGTFG